MLVKDLLTASHAPNDRVQTTYPTMRIKDCANLMKRKNVGALPVLYDGQLLGIITERDLAFNIVADDINANTSFVVDYMTTNPVIVTPTSNLTDCLELMEQNHIRHLPVVENGKLVGIISLRDVLITLFKDRDLLADQLTRFIHP